MALLLQTGASPDVIEAKTERHWKVMARAIGGVSTRRDRRLGYATCRDGPSGGTTS